jgi:hypothetical protein
VRDDSSFSNSSNSTVTLSPSGTCSSPLAETGEDLLTETLQAVLPPADEVSASIQAEIATLDDLDDAKLRDVAESEMALRDQQAFDRLLDLQSMRPLTDDEAACLEGLRADYGRVLLRKARAFALLAERGQPLPIE